MTHQTIITIDKIVFVSLDENGNPQPHGKKNRSGICGRPIRQRINANFIKNMVCNPLYHFCSGRRLRNSEIDFVWVNLGWVDISTEKKKNQLEKLNENLKNRF